MNFYIRIIVFKPIFITVVIIKSNSTKTIFLTEILKWLFMEQTQATN